MLSLKGLCWLLSPDFPVPGKEKTWLFCRASEVTFRLWSDLFCMCACFQRGIFIALVLCRTQLWGLCRTQLCGIKNMNAHIKNKHHNILTRLFEIQTEKSQNAPQKAAYAKSAENLSVWVTSSTTSSQDKETQAHSNMSLAVCADLCLPLLLAAGKETALVDFSRPRASRQASAITHACTTAKRTYLLPARREMKLK